MPQFTTLQGDCKEVMATLDANSIGTIVTDPPYGLSKDPDIEEVLKNWEARTPYVHGGAGFMGKEWDSFVPNPDVWDEAYRVLKPGGYLLAFAGTRTQGLMATSIEMAGFKIARQLSWVFGSGFPKSLNISKAIDKMSGAEREVVGVYDPRSKFDGKNRKSSAISENWRQYEGRAEVDDRMDWSSAPITAPATDEAKKWEGWGTALKPAYEPIIVAMKPFEDGTYPAYHVDWEPFKYTSKTAKKERNEGLTEEMNVHPTVKPVAVMEWLVNLEGLEGPFMDPFMGSGSTGKACGNTDKEFIGIEMDDNYFKIATARTQYAYDQAENAKRADLAENPWGF